MRFRPLTAVVVLTALLFTQQVFAVDLATFFSPLHPDIARPANFPQRLAFQFPTQAFTTDQVQDMLQGAWQPVYHCNGAPVPLDLLIQQVPADGYWKSQLFFQFKEDHFLWQQITVNSVANYGVSKGDGGTYKTIEGRFSVGLSEFENTYRLHFYNSAISPGLIRPLYSPDAKMWVMELLGKTLGNCPTGAPLNILLIPIPII